jgi:hypothetical protein
MDANELRQAECGSKRRYTKTAAKRVAKGCMTRGGPPRHPYKCPQCGQWHVGHGARVQWPAVEAVA